MRAPDRRAALARAALACAALAALAACRKSERAADTLAVSPPSGTTTAAMPTTPTVAALDAMRGRWQMRSVPEQGDTTPATYVLDASGDTSSWTLTFTGRTEPVKLHVVSAAGDSVVTQSDEYQSVLRKGMRVATTTVLRPQGDRVTGTTTARYRTRGADSVLRLRSEGTRMP